MHVVHKVFILSLSLLITDFPGFPAIPASPSSPLGPYKYIDSYNTHCTTLKCDEFTPALLEAQWIQLVLALLVNPVKICLSTKPNFEV